MLLTSCGSNSIKDPVAPVEPVVQNTSFYFSNVDDTILVDSHKQYTIGFKLNKDGYGFEGGLVRIKSFDSKYGTIENESVTTDKNGRGVFTYTPPNDIPKSGTTYAIQFSYTVLLEDQTTEELVQSVTLKFDLKETASTGGKSNYYFSNVDNVLLVESHQNYKIGFKLNKDKFAYSGGEVKVKSFDKKYGTISNETVVTDKNGVGIFNYTPPEKFPKAGTTYPIEFIFIIPTEEGQTDKKEQLSQKVTLKFNLKQTDNGGTDNYYFSEVVKSVLVDSYKPYTLSFKLNKNNFVLSGAEVKMKTFDSKYGSVKEPVVVTDENGKAAFIYNPPKNMPKKGTKYTIEYVYELVLESGETKELIQKVELTFQFDPDKDGNGRATTLSINYLNSTCDKNKGIIDHYAVHAIDTYSRKPIVGIDVSFSLINGVKVLNNNKVQNAKGTINKGNPITFSDSNAKFSSVVTADDTLIIFATKDRFDISYMGGWGIDGVNSKLQLYGNYNNIKTTKNLTYIVGNESRVLGGENGAHGDPTAAHAEIVNSTTDKDGFAHFDVVADAKLGGHTITVEAHGDENGKRFGVSAVSTVRGVKFSSETKLIPNSGGAGLVGLNLYINPSCVGSEHLIDVSVSADTFIISPSKHCSLDISKSILHTNANGQVALYVQTDGDISKENGVEDCTLKWNGTGVLREY